MRVLPFPDGETNNAMSTDQQQTLDDTLGKLDKVVSLLRWVIGGVVGASIWVTTIQLTVFSLRQDVDGIKSDRSQKLSSFEDWRRTKDVKDATQDQILANQQTQINNQQTLINLLAEKRRS